MFVCVCVVVVTCSPVSVCLCVTSTDAEPKIISEYILALVNNNKDEETQRKNCLSELDPFLKGGASVS